MAAGAPRVLTLSVLAAGVLLVSACGTPTPKTVSSADDGRGSYKIGRPYSIDGVTYYPAEDWNYSETGIASWYGPGFHGNRTASGEVYDQHQVSAAHKTLPMPSVVRVTNLDNGRSVVARINDRGPFVRGRIIDMSNAGAREIGLDVSGTARVRVEIMRRESEIVKEVAMNGGGRDAQMAALAGGAAPSDLPAGSDRSTEVASSSAPEDRSVAVQTLPAPDNAVPPPTPAAVAPPPARSDSVIVTSAGPTLLPPISSPASSAAPGSGRIYVQAGAFSQLDNAERLRRRLSSLGNTIVMPITVSGRELYRVRVGPLTDPQSADQMLGRVVEAGYREARLVAD